jgi:hypothetical protein
MSFNLTSSGAIISKCGANVNSNIVASGAILSKWCDQAEAQLSTITRKDWVADYSLVGANFKGILDDVTSDMVAIKAVTYDMSGYTSKEEAQTILDVLRDNMIRCIEVLRDDKYKEVMV